MEERYSFSFPCSFVAIARQAQSSFSSAGAFSFAGEIFSLRAGLAGKLYGIKRYESNGSQGGSPHVSTCRQRRDEPSQWVRSEDAAAARAAAGLDGAELRPNRHRPGPRDQTG